MVILQKVSAASIVAVTVVRAPILFVKHDMKDLKIISSSKEL